MKVSVIISTMNRPPSLLRLTKNLVAQNLIPNQVIIVEAGGVTWTQAMVPNDPNIDYVFIDAKGTSLSQARELGRVNAKNEILIFLDDDVILPKSYTSDVLKALSEDKGTIGVGGAYLDSGHVEKKAWKTMIGRVLGIYSDGKKNKILKTGWADYVIEPFAGKVTSADWLFGCNWAVKAKAFNDENVKIETNLARWSFLEDVILGHRLIAAYGDCLKILPSLKVLHDPMTTSGAITSETIRMRVLYRFVFWKYELSSDFKASKISYILGMIANTLLMFSQKPSINTIYECFYSYYFIIVSSPNTYQACNKFIFNKEFSKST
jgi:glycosyltransferase involved in cell wall biosynthesis